LKDFPELQCINEGGRRIYVTPTGARYPSVTTVMGWNSRKVFEQWRLERPNGSTGSLRRGSEFHKFIENYMRDGTVPPIPNSPNGLDTGHLFRQIRPFLDSLGGYEVLETTVWSRTLRVAGRMDALVRMNGVLTVIDWKSSYRLKTRGEIPDYFLQAAAYAVAVSEFIGEPVPQVAIAISAEDGKFAVYTQTVESLLPSVKKRIREFYKDKENGVWRPWPWTKFMRWWRACGKDQVNLVFSKYRTRL